MLRVRLNSLLYSQDRRLGCLLKKFLCERIGRFEKLDCVIQYANALKKHEQRQKNSSDLIIFKSD